MVVWHPGKIQPANKVIYAKRIHEASNLSNAIFRIPYNEAIAAKSFERDRGLILRADERVFPATSIFITIIHHHILLREFPGTFTSLGNHHLSCKWIGYIGRIFSRSG